ncbi:MAG TPA: DNA gyrase inhibitor YacG [Gammaproteobacteria bacterium]|nr:DNA gyrase inhibitor YacG [Gammaproteobacteria bacterium]
MQNGPDCVPCPTCGKPVEWTQQQCWRPFCSERCKLIDLGSWLDESHRVPGEAPSVLPDEQDFPNHSE